MSHVACASRWGWRVRGGRSEDGACATQPAMTSSARQQEAQARGLEAASTLYFSVGRRLRSDLSDLAERHAGRARVFSPTDLLAFFFSVRLRR
jgi:hypothetical protein